MKLGQKFSGNASLLYCAVVVLLAVAAVTAVFCYKNVEPNSSLISVIGTQENYGLSVAKYQIRLNDFELTVNQNRWGCVGPCRDLTLEYEILKSKFAILANHSESTAQLYEEAGYRDAVRASAQLFDGLDPQMKALAAHAGSTAEVNARLEALRGYAHDMGTIAAQTEFRQRDSAYQEFMETRRIICIGLAVILASVLVLSAVTILNIRRERRATRQHAKALLAEQQAAHAARAAVNAKNAFLGAIGHELRTPLQSITSAIDVIAESPLAHAQVDTVRRLEVAAKQIEAQMRDLTDYVRLDSGKLSLHRQPFDLAELLGMAAADAGCRAARKRLAFTCDIDERIRAAHSDPVRIRQIVSNLLGNAIKFTDAGTVALRGRRAQTADGEALVLEVEDTGAGVSNQKLALIFEPFTQGDEAGAVTRARDGVGMGLAIVRGLVDLLGGWIAVRSELGKGSVFSVTLPIQYVDTHDEARAPASPAERDEALHVLVVDDHEAVRESLAALLRQFGYQCDLCDSGLRAMQKLMRRPYDAVLLDVQLPDKDGTAIAREVRDGRGPNRRTPLIGVSAYQPDLLTPEQRGPFDDYLLKPVRRRDLDAALARALAERVRG
jgi:signal transduction histidine kinase/ActR/RegA family two-component response regulator